MPQPPGRPQPPATTNEKTGCNVHPASLCTWTFYSLLSGRLLSAFSSPLSPFYSLPNTHLAKLSHRLPRKREHGVARGAFAHEHVPHTQSGARDPHRTMGVFGGDQIAAVRADRGHGISGFPRCFHDSSDEWHSFDGASSDACGVASFDTRSAAKVTRFALHFSAASLAVPYGKQHKRFHHAFAAAFATVDR